MLIFILLYYFSSSPSCLGDVFPLLFPKLTVTAVLLLDHIHLLLRYQSMHANLNSSHSVLPPDHAGSEQNHIFYQFLCILNKSPAWSRYGNSQSENCSLLEWTRSDFSLPYDHNSIQTSVWTNALMLSIKSPIKQKENNPQVPVFWSFLTPAWYWFNWKMFFKTAVRLTIGIKVVGVIFRPRELSLYFLVLIERNNFFSPKIPHLRLIFEAW